MTDLGSLRKSIEFFTEAQHGVRFGLPLHHPEHTASVFAVDVAKEMLNVLEDLDRRITILEHKLNAPKSQ